MRITRGLATSACIAGALFATGAGAASASPAAPVATPATMSTTFQNPVTGSAGDPVPVVTLTVAAETGHAPGVTRLVTTSNCPSLAPPGAGVCVGYSPAVGVQWINLNTGASGTATIPSGRFGEPGHEPAVDLPTGPGRIAATVTGPIITLIPGFGTFETS